MSCILVSVLPSTFLCFSVLQLLVSHRLQKRTTTDSDESPWLQPAELPQHKLECWNWGPQPRTSGGCSLAPSRETRTIPGRHPSDTVLGTSGRTQSVCLATSLSSIFTALIILIQLGPSLVGANSKMTALHSSLLGRAALFNHSKPF